MKHFTSLQHNCVTGNFGVTPKFYQHLVSLTEPEVKLN